MAKAKQAVDPKYQKDAEQAVKETANRKYFAYSGDLPLGKTWAFTFGKSRDSELLEESNFDVVREDLEKRFPEDVENVHSSHWAVGWVDELAVRMLDGKGKVTPAGIAALEWQEKLEDYPVADEEEYNQRQYDASIENIMSEGRIDRAKAEEVFGWLWDFNQRALSDSDDQGSYPTREEIEEALSELGYNKDDDTEEWSKPPPPPPPYEDPSQLKLFGRGENGGRAARIPKTRNVRELFPRLGKLIDQGTIVVKEGEYVGRTGDGSEVAIGTVGFESKAEEYLRHHPTPDTW